ncbi:MAG: translation initiation factor IF-2 N-terminal domain-containing protein, partial [Ottowia sp.]|nr:translation initiation factor IF-2 N-terminal domain-containing protein [Ottowia sp.]
MNTTVAEFAKELRRSVETLLRQLQAAGVGEKAASDILTDDDKKKLRDYLNANMGAAAPRKKITLTQKTTSEIKQTDATGKARPIQVERRKKRTFVKPAAATPAAAAPVAAMPVIDEAERARREEEERRQSELLRRQQEEAEARRQSRSAAEAPAPEAAPQPVAAAPDAPVPAEVQEADAVQEEKTSELIADDRQEKPVKAKKDTTKSRRKAAVESPAVEERDAEQELPPEEDPAAAAEREREQEASRRKALAEAEALRAMMNAPRKVLVAKKRGEAKKAAAAENAPKSAASAKPAAEGKGKNKGHAAGGQKEIKAAKLSSSWAGDSTGRGKKGIPTRGDASGGVGRGGGWRSGAPKGGKRGAASGNVAERGRRDAPRAPAPAEHRVLEVHVPETITVAELAHKMAVKASEVIKALMKMGQMVTINQSLDQ